MSVTLIDPYRFAGFDSDYELITTTVLTGNTASVTFSNLGDYSSTYKHLQVRYTARTDRASFSIDDVILRFNSDTGNNYASHLLYGNGSSVLAAAETSASRTTWNVAAAASATANIFSGGIIDILDPYSTSKNTTIRNLAGLHAADPQIRLSSGLWNNTASITTILLGPLLGSNFVSGSRFSLYGVK
jgi:hypothetical protein